MTLHFCYLLSATGIKTQFWKRMSMIQAYNSPTSTTPHPNTPCYSRAEMWKCRWKSCSPPLKTRHQAPNWVSYAKHHIANPKLNYGFWSPRNGILNRFIRSPDQHQTGHLPDRPLSAPNRKWLCSNQPTFFVRCNFLAPPPFCLSESSILYSFSELLSICWIGCYQVDFCLHSTFLYASVYFHVHWIINNNQDI